MKIAWHGTRSTTRLNSERTTRSKSRVPDKADFSKAIQRPSRSVGDAVHRPPFRAFAIYGRCCRHVGSSLGFPSWSEQRKMRRMLVGGRHSACRTVPYAQKSS